MKFTAIAAALASASAAYAHATVQAVFLNGVDQGDGRNAYIRSPPNNSPVKDLTSSAVACNVNNVAVPKTLEISAGDVITFEWAHDNRGDDIIAESHKGPVQVYVAPTSSNGEGAVWVKIFSEAYTSQWATDKLIANKGHVSVTVPDLPAGEYLFRPEIVALHESDTAYKVNSARGVQLYMECVQFKVVSSGSVALSGGIDFKQSYTYSDPGLVYDLYNADPKTYVAPGGAVSSIAVAGQLGIGPVPAAGSKPVTSIAVVTPTSAAPTPTAVVSITTVVAPSVTVPASSSVVPTTVVIISATAPINSVTTPINSATVPISSVIASVPTSRAPLPTTKMTTVTIRSSATHIPTTSAVVSTAPACPTSPTGGNSGAAVAKYYQCGGIGYTGSTTCASGTTCTVQNPYYSQCL